MRNISSLIISNIKLETSYLTLIQVFTRLLLYLCVGFICIYYLFIYFSFLHKLYDKLCNKLYNVLIYG